jgi:3-methyladenine DNA glycosylase Tag
MTRILSRSRRGSRWLTILRKREAFREAFADFEPERVARFGERDVAGEVAPEAKALARELKRRGWRFLGPTTVYAFMQALGLVNDHLPGCAAHRTVEQARGAFEPQRKALLARRS